MAQESKSSKSDGKAKKEPQKKVSEKKKVVAKKADSSKKSAAPKKTASVAKKVPAKKESSKKTTAKKEVAKKETVKKEVAKKEVLQKNEKVVSKKVAEKAEPKKEVAFKKHIKVKDRNKTTFVKPQEVVKNWIILDAAGKPLGRVAALAASMLRGKHKVDFTPNVDCGDSVIIINCKDVVLTGKKLEQKVRYHHSGWIGGIKETRYVELMKKNPQKAMTFAVVGMLPHNSLGRKMAKHLRTYKDDKHGHEAQKPTEFRF